MIGKSESNAFLSSGLTPCGKDGRYGLSEVKLEAGSRHWQGMNLLSASVTTAV